MSNKRFSLGKAPYVRRADSGSETTSWHMYDLLIALAPIIIFGFVKNGLMPFIAKDTNFWGMIYPLLLPLIGGAFSVLLEFLWYKFIIKNKPICDRMKTSYAVIPGLMLGMIVSVTTPIWVLLMGVAFATILGKLIFGGFGHNIFNPALIGFLFLTTYSYATLVSGGDTSGFLNPSEAVHVIGGVTPMTGFAKGGLDSFRDLINEYGLFNMFLGFKPGAIGETSVLLILVGFLYLVLRKVINWRIPVLYVGSVFVLTYIIGAFNGYANTLDFALFGIMNGGLMFGAVFMATEPVTSPRNPNGKVIYALALGVLTVVFRFASKIPEGVAVSILTLNMFTAIIEKVSAKLRVEPKKSKVVLTYSLIGLLLAGIATFPVVSSISHEETPEVLELSFVSNEQDYSTFNFVYVINDGEADFNVVVDHTYKIISISNDEYDTDEARELIDEIIKGKKIVNYVTNASESSDELFVEVTTKGFAGSVFTVITYNNAGEITNLEVTYNETYDIEYNQPNWEESYGHPKDIIPGEIIANQDDLDNVQVVAGATVTSKAMVEAVRVAAKYVDYLSDIEGVMLVGKFQDLTTLDFVYVLRNASGKFNVSVNHDYELITAVEAEIKEEVETFIAANKFIEYIESATATEVIIITKGYGTNPPIRNTFTFNSNYEITAVVVEHEESYAISYNQPNWQESHGHPQDVLPGEIISSQPDFSEIQVVAGATVTSKAVLRAAKMAVDYLSNLEANNE